MRAAAMIPPRRFRLAALAAACALRLAADPAMAQIAPERVEMTCRNFKGAPYRAAYEVTQKKFVFTNPRMSNDARVQQVRTDDSGVLVWVSVPVFGGERDILAQFGREKWIKYFYGNGSVVTDVCR